MVADCVQITLEGLGEKFENAVAIMAWLAKCAKAVAAEGHCVQWTTPMGLPVIQPYRVKVSCSRQLRRSRAAAMQRLQAVLTMNPAFC